jgi:putative spermidine/putrescine transport system permease protein
MLKDKKRFLVLLPLLPFVMIVLIYLIIPIIHLIIKSFLKEDGIGFTFKHYLTIFSKDYYLQAISNSLWISVISAVIGILIALFAANAANHLTANSKNKFLAMLNMTSNFSGVPLAFAYIILLGHTGILVILGKRLGIESLGNFNIYTTIGLIITYIYFQIPLATLLLIPTFEGLRKEWREAAMLLKANGFQYWMYVGIPIILPSVFSTLSVLFANALAAYATAYALLASNFSLLPIRISEMFVGDVYQRPELGSALSVVMMVLMVVAVQLNTYLLKKAKGR